jgi:cyclophilin family peptidyl-prolyl cis-trans isomerase
MNKTRMTLGILVGFAICPGLALGEDEPAGPRVKLTTTHGDIVIELDPVKAPETVKNFLQYTKDKFFDGTIFHRVIDNFMIQGGGFTEDMKQKETRDPIQNEAKNGLKNKRGTIAMARTGDPHSATAQFFINVQDNAFLDYPSRDNWGYCVFGKVVSGMEVVDKIKGVKTGRSGGQGDVPLEPVVIKTAELVEVKKAEAKAEAEGEKKAPEEKEEKKE